MRPADFLRAANLCQRAPALHPTPKPSVKFLKTDMQGLAILPKGWFDINLQEVTYKSTGKAPSIPVLAYASALSMITEDLAGLCSAKLQIIYN